MQDLTSTRTAMSPRKRLRLGLCSYTKQEEAKVVEPLLQTTPTKEQLMLSK